MIEATVSLSRQGLDKSFFIAYYVSCEPLWLLKAHANGRLVCKRQSNLKRFFPLVHDARRMSSGVQHGGVRLWGRLLRIHTGTGMAEHPPFRCPGPFALSSAAQETTPRGVTQTFHIVARTAQFVA